MLTLDVFSQETERFCRKSAAVKAVTEPLIIINTVNTPILVSQFCVCFELRPALA